MTEKNCFNIFFFFFDKDVLRKEHFSFNLRKSYLSKDFFLFFFSFYFFVRWTFIKAIGSRVKFFLKIFFFIFVSSPSTFFPYILHDEFLLRSWRLFDRATSRFLSFILRVCQGLLVHSIYIVFSFLFYIFFFLKLNVVFKVCF